MSRGDAARQLLIAGLIYKDAPPTKRLVAMSLMGEAAKRLSPTVHAPEGRPAWWRHLEGKQLRVALAADAQRLSITQLARRLETQPRALGRWLQNKSGAAESRRVEDAISRHLGVL